VPCLNFYLQLDSKSIDCSLKQSTGARAERSRIILEEVALEPLSYAAPAPTTAVAQHRQTLKIDAKENIYDFFHTHKNLFIQRTSLKDSLKTL
jgi:hypothetical protein